MEKEFALIVILYHMLCIWRCVRAETVTISSDTCGDYFDFGSDSFIGPDVTVLYKGDPVNTRLEDGCYIKLINWDSFQQTICIDVLTMNINNCRTNVSIYRNIISKYLDPKKSWSCGSSTCCTWCGTTRTSNLYVLVKSSHAASRPVVDDVKLRFYRKGLPGRKSYESETSSSYTVGIVVGLVFVLVFIFIIACVVVARKRRQRMTNMPHVLYQATPIPANGSSQPQYGQPAAGYSPYQPHPNTNQYQPAVTPSAPALGGMAVTTQANIYDPNAPPPSYEDCIKT
ncbi:uncharacterized protein LOC128220237 isoform X1 [Mya arenaria]|uniref:uncharacterized protein LOC128220237 isoform X1 n=2 Tax=Mya arenaria TaxID=6604 RepID=UPI0022E24295|nr:uncharacterized protein LOC128220237 isoform X1 [Mya arenaria]XP_052784501.1 uncharacterized protein LOC128220237 isoform X1 [Mya arenaria]